VQAHNLRLAVKPPKITSVISRHFKPCFVRIPESSPPLISGTQDRNLMTQSHFERFALNTQILRAVAEEGYQTPTPIQLAAIPELMTGHDLLATAQTGTGKTAAFALPMLHLLHARQARGARNIRALILTPTRELALQIDASMRAYGRHLALGTAVILGGVPAGPQIRALGRQPQILIATPGRLLDLMSQGFVRLERIEMLVLDEADRMLDMGFIHDVRKIVSRLPASRQTMFFSATLCGEIAELAADMLSNPVKVAVTPPASVSVKIEQRVFFVDQENKRDLLTGMLKKMNIQRALVFTRTKHRANRIMQQLSNAGISVDAIHSNKSQNARQRALEDFDRGRIRVLVATDIVARGIDVEGISHVINFELPNEPESYVHRIGRTARAGAAGIAMSFCSADEVAMLKDIEKLTRCELTADEDHRFHSATTAALYKSHAAAPLRIPRGEGRRGKPSAPRRSGRTSRGRSQRAY
jgi:ATP-dependent RNA helicase RhlE